METLCTRCGTKLTIDDDLAGQSVRCGKCEYLFAAQPMDPPSPAADTSVDHDATTSPEVAAVAAAGQDDVADDATAAEVDEQRWFLRIPEGSEFGPVDRRQLDLWVRQGRVSSDCELRTNAEGSWTAALLMYPMLQGQGNPFASIHQSGPQAQLEPHRGNKIFALSVVGCVIPFLSVWPAVMGTRDLRRMQVGKMDARGEVLTRAGQAIAMVSSMIWIGAFAVALLTGLVGIMNGL